MPTTPPPTHTTYSICYEHSRKLRNLARSEREGIAIARLDKGTGTAQDMWLAVELYESAGQRDLARDLGDMIVPGRVEEPDYSGTDAYCQGYEHGLRDAKRPAPPSAVVDEHASDAKLAAFARAEGEDLARNEGEVAAHGRRADGNEGSNDGQKLGHAKRVPGGLGHGNGPCSGLGSRGVRVSPRDSVFAQEPPPSTAFAPRGESGESTEQAVERCRARVASLRVALDRATERFDAAWAAFEGVPCDPTGPMGPAVEAAEALERAERDLAAVHRELSQATAAWLEAEAAETASVRAEVRELTRMMRGGGAS